jgi:glyceraldehyde 3-phosphate dehydrogenase
MTLTVGINGFGRIGRLASRIILNSPDLTLGAINSLSSAQSHAYLLKHDSTQGPFDKGLENTKIFQYKEPQEIPWKDAGVDVVLECTGKFRTTEEASKHAVNRVVISAPVKDETPTFIMGVNHKTYKGQVVVSNSSCTTNCVVSVLSVLEGHFSVLRGSMTTVHAVTDSQNLLDNSHKKEVRLRRSALNNMIPTTSGSGRDVAKIFPHLLGSLPCRSIRVPLPAVSLIELVVEVGKKTTREEVNAAFVESATGSLKGILAVAEEELVSTDYIGNSHSAVVDPFLTDVIGDTLVRVTAWYDNEWGYANRLVDLARLVSKP